jgi:predicted ATPase
MGEVEEAIRLTQVGLGKLVDRGARLFLTYWAAWAAQVLAWGGEPEEGLKILEEMGRHPSAGAELWMGSEILRVRGELLLALRRPRLKEAEKSFREAIDVARRQEARWYELRSTTSLARFLEARGRGPEGKSLLEEIYGWFTEGFDTPPLKEAAALLARL